MQNNIEQQEQQLWDEAEEASRGIIHPHRGGWVNGYFEARKKSLAELAAARKEIEELRAWKESAMSVDYDPQRVGKLLGVGLGQSVHDKVVPGIERLLAEIAELKEAGHEVGAQLEETELKLSHANREIASLKADLARVRTQRNEYHQEVIAWQKKYGVVGTARQSFTPDQVREMLGRAIDETIEAFKEYQLPQNRFEQELYKDLTILEIMAGAERAKENSNQKPNT